eukprot:gnl/MRDRNA2_/MRDRNA2_150107_c0_seq1.p3 gnl/MRDRNA2_/MRDRNA2_150107_c0~~gnl/MRDRNA2_/MRDRNA2_150107_c0_seq1.p3  ORF type:complete len:107 (-),score=24.45 gnl/MRDRNA2_/MRDRNA2_150107_c0_seq1:846-1145(-)
MLALRYDSLKRRKKIWSDQQWFVDGQKKDEVNVEEEAKPSLFITVLLVVCPCCRVCIGNRRGYEEDGSAMSGFFGKIFDDVVKTSTLRALAAKKKVLVR